MPSLTLSLANLALDPDTAPELLEKLAEDEDPQVREAVAQNPNTPPHTLFGLAVEFPQQFLENPALPLLLLEKTDLFAELPPETIVALLQLEDLPQRFLEDAAHSPDLRVKAALAKHPHLPLPLMERSLADELWSVRNALRENPKVPEELIDLLLRAGHQQTHSFSPNPNPPQNPDPNLSPQELSRLASMGPFGRRVAAIHPRTDLALLEKLAGSEHHALHLWIAENPVLTPSLLEKIVEGGNPHAFVKVAFHPNTPPELLTRLAGEQYASVCGDVLIRKAHTPVKIMSYGPLRSLIAHHPCAPVALLERLAEDDETKVRAGVAQNPEAPLPLLEKLLGDSRAEVRQRALRHPRAPRGYVQLLRRAGSAPDLSRRVLKEDTLSSEERARLLGGGFFAKTLAAVHHQTPPEILRALARETDPEIQGWVARNPRCPGDLLEDLSASKEEDVRFWVAGNPRCSAEILARLACDPHKGVRSAVARNPGAPSTILAALSRDGAPYVRYGLTQNPHAPEESLRALACDPDPCVRLWAERRLSAP